MSLFSLQISWSPNGSLVAITGDDSFYLLKFDRDAYASALESGEEITDEGVEAAFELVAEVTERFVIYPSYSLLCGQALFWMAVLTVIGLVYACGSNSVKTSKWVGDCFIYTTASNKLSYLVGDQSHTINHFDQSVCSPFFLLSPICCFALFNYLCHIISSSKIDENLKSDPSTLSNMTLLLMRIGQCTSSVTFLPRTESTSPTRTSTCSRTPLLCR